MSILGIRPSEPDVTMQVTRNSLEIESDEIANADVEFWVRCLDPTGMLVAIAEPEPPAGNPKIVFVTSEVYGGNLGGLAGADLKCNDLAGEAELPGDYKAWLSIPGTSVVDRFSKGGDPYLRVDGFTIAVDWADVIDGFIDVPINRDENGITPGGPPWVWTGTDHNGLPQEATGRLRVDPITGFCSDWTLDDGEHVGLLGEFFETGAGWTFGDIEGQLCGPAGNVNARLYCFEQ